MYSILSLHLLISWIPQDWNEVFLLDLYSQVYPWHICPPMNNIVIVCDRSQCQEMDPGPIFYSVGWNKNFICFQILEWRLKADT